MTYLATKNRPVSVMDELLDSMFYGRPADVPSWKPFPVDVTDEGDNYRVSAELPGFAEGEVDVTLNDNLMVISAEKKSEEENGETKYLVRERVEGKYKRSFTLPKDADRESIKATLKEGILNLVIGKKPEAKPFTVKIN